MSKMISIASGFQYSVNIGYDLNNDDKIKNFIPTASALRLMEDILLSTSPSSTERARVLIGAYGKGKSHIMLTILSLLMKKELSLFSRTLSKIEGTKLYQNILNYYESSEKILPIVITGSNTNLTQAFILSLQRTLSTYGLLDVMPETNYKAAINVINRWKREYPDTYNKLCKLISVPIHVFLNRLKDYDTSTYDEFEKIYPSLTAGSTFNPFLGFDVVELYENAARGLRKKGFTGLFVVYDEFSKYLEANIASASVSDTKMLQDFAEKCNRSASLQMHIMLISHKEIANYIDVLPKQKVDSWRGVSERFLHVRLSNNFSQTYEIIETVIQKESAEWKAFCAQNESQFCALEERYSAHLIYSNIKKDGIKKIIRGCYPLHPVSTFILPRLSERIAQNERTLFTFLSANGVSTLPNFLDAYRDDSFTIVTPDYIYDYFEPLFRKEVYSGALHDNYVLTEIILEQLVERVLERKLVKTISLIYILEQFEKLRPTKEELYGIFSFCYQLEEIESAINSLIEDKFVVYQKKSNNYLRLKQSSGVNIQQEIHNVVENRKIHTTVEDALNEVDFEKYLYPSRYNDEHEMIRYFSFRFISEKTLDTPDVIKAIIEDEKADGVIFAVLPESYDSILDLRKKLTTDFSDFVNAVFVLPKKYIEIEEAVREYLAVRVLRDQAIGDKVLFNEYEVVFEDLRDLIVSFISSYTRPELYKSLYFYSAQEIVINRKAALSELLSKICDKIYSKTPVINNEALNRNEATSMARNSRNKIVAALLRTELEPNLGLSGTGQEVSIMRSTLIRTGVLEDTNGIIRLNLHPDCDKGNRLSGLMGEIEDFIDKAAKHGAQPFSDLYCRLCCVENGISIRKELIPIYLAAVLHEYKQQVILKDRFGQVSLTAETIVQLNALPDKYTLEYLDWNPEKSEFVCRLEEIFNDSLSMLDKGNNTYDLVISAMKRWYVSLPKYAKEIKLLPDGKQIDKGYEAFINLLRKNPPGHEFLFESIPCAFGYQKFVAGVADNICAAKSFFDDAVPRLRSTLAKEMKSLFVPNPEIKKIAQMSLTSIIRDWCGIIDERAFEQIFQDGTGKCLALFRSISNDEDTFVARVAKLSTDLRLEDWNDQTLEKCIAMLKRFKETAESFKPLITSEPHRGVEADRVSDTYQVVFTSDDGNATKRSFEKVETGSRAKLLMNKIIYDLDSFGQAVTEAEKRQVLMDVLKKFC